MHLQHSALLDRIRLVAGGEFFAKHAPTGMVSAELYTP
jgi:hypothetical protein